MPLDTKALRAQLSKGRQDADEPEDDSEDIGGPGEEEGAALDDAFDALKRGDKQAFRKAMHAAHVLCEDDEEG